MYDGLTGSQAAVVDDTGPVIPEVEIDIFFDKVLPRPKIIDKIDEILVRLERGYRGSYNRQTKRWRVFKDHPVTSGMHANVASKNVVSIANAISVAAEAFSDGEAALTRFDQDPNQAPKSDWRSGESRPDGYFILRDSRSGQTAHWMDIVATGEYKRDDDDVRNIEDVRRLHDARFHGHKHSLRTLSGLEEGAVEHAPDSPGRSLPSIYVWLHDRGPHDAHMVRQPCRHTGVDAVRLHERMPPLL